MSGTIWHERLMKCIGTSLFATVTGIINVDWCQGSKRRTKARENAVCSLASVMLFHYVLAPAEQSWSKVGSHTCPDTARMWCWACEKCCGSTHIWLCSLHFIWFLNPLALLSITVRWVAIAFNASLLCRNHDFFYPSNHWVTSLKVFTAPKIDCYRNVQNLPSMSQGTPLCDML